MMTKRLQKVGGSLALVVEKPILSLLGITEETELEITTDGHGLHIMPKVPQAGRDRFEAAKKRTFENHGATLAKLAK